MKIWCTVAREKKITYKGTSISLAAHSQKKLYKIEGLAKKYLAQ